MVHSEASFLLFLGVFSMGMWFGVFAMSLNKSSVDESSLLSIKAYINSDILAMNWSSKTSFCTWTGIICGRRHPDRVTGLDLSNMGLRGNIAKEIGNLTFLRFVDISNNSINGLIPIEIGLLRRLQGLNLSNNYLSGDIPTSLSACVKLKMFDLSHNNLSGNVPAGFGNWSQLQKLSLRSNYFTEIHIGNVERRFDLRANQFHGQIPNSISNLSKLITLDLSDNLFTHVPMNLGNLYQLQMLNLEANLLTNNLSNFEQDFLSSLVACKNLKFIQISFNHITGILPKSLGSSNLSSSLETFKAVSCRLLDPIPDEIGNLSSLLWLNLGFNHFTGAIPTALGCLRSLRSFEIHGNRFYGSVSPVLCNLNHLFSLNLAINNLSGQLPSCLGNLSSLREIHLSDNEFNSNLASILWFRKGVGNVKNLVALDLSRNQLSGEIPSTISQLQSLSRLLLSRNKLRGPIVKSFADLKDLQYLDLSHNHLSGPIPKSLETLPRLNYFDVSFNELTGEIPDRGCFVNLTGGQFYIGNKGLCGASRFKVKKCRSLSMKKRLSYLSVLIVLIIGLTAVGIWKIRARKQSLKPESPPDIMHRRISYPEILRATSNLDENNLIGRGSAGSVFKGYFCDGVHVVKVFDLDVQDALKSFNTERKILSRIRHRNLVKMIDYCSQIDFKALVMTHMPNGDLEKWLHASSCSFNLLERLRLMIDVAFAIQYLHEDYIHPIVHCDINPKNILLDEDMVAHVGDFGIAKLLSQEERMLHSATLGTVGYIAPEYGSKGLISTTVDVYSYGILLMEMLSRRKPTDDMFSGELTLRRWVSESFPNSIFQIVDNELLDMHDEEARAAFKSCLISYIWLALECTADLPEERPNMRDVLSWIRNINAELQIKLGCFDRKEYCPNLGFCEESNFEDLEVLEEADIENGEQHHRLEVITNNQVQIIRPMVMSLCLHSYFHPMECQRNQALEDTYRRFLQSSEEMNVGIGYGVSAQYFLDIENVEVDFEEHHINAYLAILHIDPMFA